MSAACTEHSWTWRRTTAYPGEVLLSLRLSCISCAEEDGPLVSLNTVLLGVVRESLFFQFLQGGGRRGQLTELDPDLLLEYQDLETFSSDPQQCGSILWSSRLV